MEDNSSRDVLIVCNQFYPLSTGYSNAALNFINALSNQTSLTIDILTTTPLGDKKEISFNNVRVIRLPSPSSLKVLKWFINSYHISKEITKRQKTYRMIFFETFDEAILLSLLPRSLYRKIAVRAHATNDTEYTFYFYSSLLFLINRILLTTIVARKIIHIVSTNHYHIEFIKKHYLKGNLCRIASKQYFVIPNTVGIFDSPNKVSNTPEKIRLFLLGRMDRNGMLQKGFVDFISALILIGSEIVNKDFDITIVGKGEGQKQLIRKTNQHGFQSINYISELNHEEIMERLRDNDVVVLCSRFEGMSMFSLEALATGNVVLFSRTGALTDMVMENGFLFEPQNIEDLAEKLETLRLTDRDKLHSMKTNSCKLAATKFSHKAVAKRFADLMQIMEV